MKPVKKSRTLVVVFSLLSAFIYYTLFFVIFPRMSVYYYLLSTGMIGLKLFPTFAAVVNMNPGKITHDSSLSFLSLLKQVAPRHICADCRCLRTPRSRHCNVCGECVERYDTHCGWINQCVGLRNNLYYFSFMWFVWLDLLLVIFIAMQALGEGPYDWHDTPLGAMCFGCKSDTFFYIACGVDMLLCGVFFVLATIIFYILSKNYCYNKTTFERMAKN
mmetsp:Transcript_47044/g.34423  ORF Transcript_47044/g.34423 Transcript_47044/m.34423 type:complete len:218 (-) Transcript_47044:377-1030(-)